MELQKLFGKKEDNDGVAMKMFAVRDEKAQAFIEPLVFSQVGEAERWLMDLARNERSTVSKHPEDFTLYQIGTFNTGTAAIVAMTPLRICSANELVVKKESPSA